MGQGYEYLKAKRVTPRYEGSFTNAFAALPQDVQNDLNKLDGIIQHNAFWRFIDNAIILHQAVESCDIKKVAFHMSQTGRYLELERGNNFLSEKSTPEEQQANLDLYHHLLEMAEEGLGECTCGKRHYPGWEFVDGRWVTTRTLDKLRNER